MPRPSKAKRKELKNKFLEDQFRAHNLFFGIPVKGSADRIKKKARKLARDEFGLIAEDKAIGKLSIDKLDFGLKERTKPFRRMVRRRLEAERKLVDSFYSHEKKPIPTSSRKQIKK